MASMGVCSVPTVHIDCIEAVSYASIYVIGMYNNMLDIIIIGRMVVNW